MRAFKQVPRSTGFALAGLVVWVLFVLPAAMEGSEIEGKHVLIDIGGQGSGGHAKVFVTIEGRRRQKVVDTSVEEGTTPERMAKQIAKDMKNVLRTTFLDLFPEGEPAKIKISTMHNSFPRRSWSVLMMSGDKSLKVEVENTDEGLIIVPSFGIRLLPF